MKTRVRKLSPEQWAKQRIETLEQALQFYAKHLGHSNSLDYRIITQDGGRRAREALGTSVSAKDDTNPWVKVSPSEDM